MSLPGTLLTSNRSEFCPLKTLFKFHPYGWHRALCSPYFSTGSSSFQDKVQGTSWKGHWVSWMPKAITPRLRSSKEHTEMVISIKREKWCNCSFSPYGKADQKLDIQVVKKNGDTEGPQSWAERGREEFFSEENRFLCQQSAVPMRRATPLLGRPVAMVTKYRAVPYAHPYHLCYKTSSYGRAAKSFHTWEAKPTIRPVGQPGLLVTEHLSSVARNKPTQV